MGIKEDYEKAIELAKAGKLEQAQALLITIDHPKAEVLLEKVNKAIAARGNSGKKNQAQINNTKAKEKQQGIGCLVTLGIISACALGIVLTMPSQPETSIDEVCKYQILERNVMCSPSRVMRDYRPMIDACYDVWNAANSYNIVYWTECLENKSVDLSD